MDISDTELVIQNALSNAPVEVIENREQTNSRMAKRRKYMEEQNIIKKQYLSDELRKIQMNNDQEFENVAKQAIKLKKIRDRKQRLGVDSSRETKENKSQSEKIISRKDSQPQSITDSEKERMKQMQMITFQAQPDNNIVYNQDGAFETLGMNIQRKVPMRHVKEEPEGIDS